MTRQVYWCIENRGNFFTVFFGHNHCMMSPVLPLSIIFVSAWEKNIFPVHTRGMLTGSLAVYGGCSGSYLYLKPQKIIQVFLRKRSHSTIKQKTIERHIWMVPTPLNSVTNLVPKILHDSPLDSLKSINVPWRKILTSVPMLGLLVGHVGSYFGITILMIEIPAYLNSVLHFSVQQVSVQE
ncbi:UNVERIFIED_CONTAM: hypothetical protein NCL1_32540 [Trichonephila clavipes]